MPETQTLPAAVVAFGALADRFDTRFGEWQSVAAQRRAVRRYLLQTFPPGARLLELAGGTGADAIHLGAHGRHVLMTDGAADMVARAAAEVAAAGVPVETAQLVLEEAEAFADAWQDAPFDGVYSNFAGLNCVADLGAVARGLARLTKPGAAAVLVMFGPLPPGEVAVQLLRGDADAAFRRLRRDAVAARIGGREFRVFYPRPSAVAAAFAPWFRLERVRGVGVFVPPSAAEPFVSRLPRLVRGLELLDRVAAAPLARLGDHVLLHFVRTDLSVAGADTPPDMRAFRGAYAEHRATEGRAHTAEELLELPYLRSGPLAQSWAVRARTFDHFMRHVVEPLAHERARPLDVADLGAGAGWLAYRLQRAGHHAVAIDMRSDAVDGLGCAHVYDTALGSPLRRCAASFDELPLAPGTFDIAVFNASLHYALDLPRVLGEAHRLVRSGGRIVILDSPFYGGERAGRAMVAAKHRAAARTFGARAAELTAPPFIEFLTRQRLAAASAGLSLGWRRLRVRYPLWYELRPVVAQLRAQRAPSRFDVWEAVAP